MKTTVKITHADGETSLQFDGPVEVEIYDESGEVTHRHVFRSDGFCAEIGPVRIGGGGGVGPRPIQYTVNPGQGGGR